MLYEAGTDDQGRKTYRIRTQSLGTTEYLNQGGVYSEATGSYYVESGTNTDDLWVLERVYVDGHDIQSLVLNAWQINSVGAAYNEKQYLAFRSEVDSRYKVEIQSTSASISHVESNSSYESLLDSYPYGDLYVLDVFFRAGEVYYIPVMNSGYTDASYSIRIRQLTATYHSAPDDLQAGENGDGKIYFYQDVNKAITNSRVMNLYNTNRVRTTAQEALNAINNLTGYSDFNSEIFLFSGHGGNKENYIAALYERTAAGDGFIGVRSVDLPNMSNCELVVWDCCYSAATQIVDERYGVIDITLSLAQASIQNGAKTVLAWTTRQVNGISGAFIEGFFASLSEGKAVIDAKQDAASVATAFAHTYIEQATTEERRQEIREMLNRTVNGAVIMGEQNNVLFPKTQEGSSLNSRAISQENIPVILDRDQYTLIVDNDSLEIKLYAKFEDGVMTSDWFMEYYRGGILLRIEQFGN